MNNFKYIFCDKSYEVDLMKFISNNWKKDHILSTNKDLLKWQYLDDKNNYHFVIAIENNKIIGILGFIPFGKYSKINNLNFCLALWIVNKNTNFPGLGVGMISFLRKRKQLNNIYTIGLSDDAVKIYTALKFNISSLRHFIIINNKIREFGILKNVQRHKLYSNKNERDYCRLIEVKAYKKISDIFDRYISLHNNNKNKNLEYLLNRYYKNPFYKYRFFLLKDKDRGCMIIVRKVSYKQYTALRIIDCVGDFNLISLMGSSLKKLIINENHEYIDFLQYGIETSILDRAGFIEVDQMSGLIAPNNFEPFEQKNKNIYFAYKNYSRQYTNKYNDYFFKGDGDQDRPNIL